jgi:hypothetical protein
LNLVPLQLALSNENRPGVHIEFRTSWRTDGGRSDTAPSVTDFVRLDDWANENGLNQLDLIKIDVDGFEGLAIDGAMGTIAKFRPVILMEAFEGQFERGGPDAFELLESLGYRFWTAKGEKQITANQIRPRLKALSANGVESFNLFALGSS